MNDDLVVLGFANYTPKLINTIINSDNIELIYKETSNFAFMTYPAKYDIRVYKIIYSCVDGKWNVSEKIYGEIIKATSESYKF